MYFLKTGRVNIRKSTESTANIKNCISESSIKFARNITIKAESANQIVTSPGIIIYRIAAAPDKIAQNNAPIFLSPFFLINTLTTKS